MMDTMHIISIKERIIIVVANNTLLRRPSLYTFTLTLASASYILCRTPISFVTNVFAAFPTITTFVIVAGIAASVIVAIVLLG